MKLAFVTSWVSRRAGGLSYVIRPLAQEMATYVETSVYVFGIDDGQPQDDIAVWGSALPRVFQRVGPTSFGYAPGMLRALRDSTYDLAHTHGLWMYPSLAVLRWSRYTERPYVVTPHGMLNPTALRISGWKKRVGAVLYENRHLCGAACLHALCEVEAVAFRQFGLKNPIAVIPNGVDLPPLLMRPGQPRWARDVPLNARVLLFLGRLHPIKGLPNLLKAWARQRPLTTEPWVLVIAGWGQNDHRAELEQTVAALGIGKTVRFVGPQFGEEKSASLNRAEAFVVPSFSEGLPIAVLEAWAYRLPVLMTSQCNLSEGFKAGAAIEVAPEVESLSNGLETLFDLNETALADIGARGRFLVESRFTWARVAQEMCSVYRWVLGQGERPNCVVLD